MFLVSRQLGICPTSSTTNSMISIAFYSYMHDSKILLIYSVNFISLILLFVKENLGNLVSQFDLTIFQTYPIKPLSWLITSFKYKLQFKWIKNDNFLILHIKLVIQTVGFNKISKAKFIYSEKATKIWRNLQILFEII